MRALLYVAAFYGATCVGGIAAFTALCVQAARRDRAEEEAAEPQVPTMPTQRPPVENDPLAMSATERLALVEARCWAQEALADDDRLAQEVFVAWLREDA